MAEPLAEEGIDVEVIDLRTLVAARRGRPCSRRSAKTRRAVVVHEAVRAAASAPRSPARIHEELFGDLERPVQRVGAADTPVPYAKNLETDFVPQQSDIEAAVRKLLG